MRSGYEASLVGLMLAIVGCGDEASQGGSGGGSGATGSGYGSGATSSASGDGGAGPGTVQSSSGASAPGSSSGATSSGAGTSGGAGGGPTTPIGDPDYKEGFGRDATGGEGHSTYVVTSSDAAGPGSFFDAFAGGAARDVTIVFAVSTVTLPDTVYIGSNVTIDGSANGMSGVTLDATAEDSYGLIIEDPASNIVIRGINFRSAGTPDSGFPERDLLALDGTNGSAITDVFVDRCTFMQASDGALDITGDVSRLTVQRSLFYGNAKTMLVKYGTRRDISIHHNVFTRNGERNPQVKGDIGPADLVNNVIFLNDVLHYADGSDASPYGTLLFSCAGDCDSAGDVVANVVGSAYLGDGATLEVRTESGGSDAGIYLGDNYCEPASNCPSSPLAAPNPIASAYAITTLPLAQLGSALLPVVGAPNREPPDQERIDDVAAALP